MHVKIVIAALILARGSNLSAQPPLPPGWRALPTDARGVATFEATGLSAGEQLTIRQLPDQRLGGAAVAQWLRRIAAADPAPMPATTWKDPAPQLGSQSASIATATRAFINSAGRPGAVVWIAATTDQQQVRLLRVVASSESLLRTPQGQAAKDFVSSLAAGVGSSAVRSNTRSAAIVSSAPSSSAPSSSAPSVNGIRPGGAIVPGRYAGNFIHGDGSLLFAIQLTIFPNGEYAYSKGEPVDDSVGVIRYSAASGKLDITSPLENNEYSPDEDFCLFGRDGRGAPVIYAEDYYGIGTKKVLLRRVGDVTRLAPTLVAAARTAAQTEAARYKFVTAPGAGVPPTDIEAVYYEWKQEQDIGGLQLREAVFLLLRDGAVRRGIPVAPQALDARLSRRMEPALWGRWRRAGTTYEFAWPDAPARFAPMQGHVVVAAAPGATLHGTYEGSSSYQLPGGAGSWSKFGVTFAAGGRFEKFRSGGSGASIGAGETTVSSATVYDDDGSAGGVSSTVFAGGGRRRTPDTGNRSGTYRVDGHAIILTYDNGRVERLPFVIEQDRSGRVKGVWMLGALLTPARR
jgi:hypothetical protein